MSYYDLEERTALFSEKIILLCKNVPKDAVTRPLISQLVRSGTSIGANYNEANGASSRRDFRNKIYICKKEAKETMYWLKIFPKADKTNSKEFDTLWQEAYELSMIFAKIAAKTEIE